MILKQLGGWLLAFLLSGIATPSARGASLISYGAVGDGLTDTVPAWNAAVTATCASPTDRTVSIPAGRFLFLSPPVPIPCALILQGQGPAATTLIKGYGNTFQFLEWVGGQDPYGGGILRDLFLDAGSSTGGIALWIRAHLETDPLVSSRNPHGLLIDNVLIGTRGVIGGGTWNYGAFVDGSANASPPTGVAPGIRYVRFRNVSVARASIVAYLFYYAYGIMAVQIDCFAPLSPTGGLVWNLHTENVYILSTSCGQETVP